MTLSAHARFLYRVERRGAEWRIMGFDAIYIRDELTPAIPGQSISISSEELKGSRSTYRMLSYFLKSQNYEVDSNLAGEDRSDLVEALMNSRVVRLGGSNLKQADLTAALRIRSTADSVFRGMVALALLHL
jgi:hypothetical protein